jgi:hypothetical protein
MFDPKRRPIDVTFEDVPNVNGLIILLPQEHHLRCSIIPCRHVACHLLLLSSSHAEVTDLEVTILIDEDVGCFQVSMDDAGRMDVLQPPKDLVQKVLRARNVACVNRVSGADGLDTYFGVKSGYLDELVF